MQTLQLFSLLINYKTCNYISLMCNFASKISPNVVAERVLKQEEHKLEGSTLSVREYLPLSKETEQDSSVQDDTLEAELRDTIEVTGITPKTSKDVLEMFFESKKKSGGGEIIHFEFNEIGNAVIKFKEAEGMSKAKEGVFRTLLPRNNAHDKANSQNMWESKLLYFFSQKFT